MAVTKFQSYFMGLIFETLFYGMFLLIFTVSVYLKWDHKRDSPKPIGSMILDLFSISFILLVTAHWILNIWDCYEILANSNGSTAIEQAFANWGTIKNVVQFCMYATQVLMGDLILIYRLYRVSDNVRYIIFPSITCAATMGCGIMLIRSVAEVTTSDSSFLNDVRTWGIASASMTLIENFYGTGMIAFHIWTKTSQFDGRCSDVSPVFRILIESAGLWLACLLATFILFLSNNYAYMGMVNLTSPVLGISFSLIMVRLLLLTRNTIHNLRDIGDSSAIV